MSNGKGMAPRKGYNWQKYADNYDGIFRKQPTQPEKEPMKPNQDQPSTQPTILPWHREAAESINGLLQTWGEDALSEDKYAAIIARHDPHAETLRLLEEIEESVNRAMSLVEFGERGNAQNELGYIKRRLRRAHLVAQKGTQ